MSFRTLSGVLALVVAVSVGSGGVVASTAAAQTTPARTQVEADLKGMIGLGLLGAEVGFVVPALAGLDETWAFIVFPVAGAGAGAAAGYFLLEDGGGHPELAVGFVAAAMTLAIPTAVITLSATAYDDSDEAAADDAAPLTSEDDPVSAEPTDGAAEPAPAGEPAAAPAPADAAPAAAPQSTLRHRARPQPGLVQLSRDGLALGVPALHVAQTYSDEEVRRTGVTQRSEVRMPLFSGTF